MDGDEILTLYPILLKDLKMPSIWFYSSKKIPTPTKLCDESSTLLSLNLGLGRGLGDQPVVLTTRLANEETAAGEGKRWVQSHTGQGVRGSAGM